MPIRRGLEPPGCDQAPAEYGPPLAGHPCRSESPRALTVRVTQKTTIQDYLRRCPAGIAAQGAAGATIVLDQPVGVQRLPGFGQGMVSVQDTAAQMAVPLLLAGLRLDRGLRILDACAAPGGKTGQLLELADAQVLALEIAPVILLIGMVLLLTFQAQHSIRYMEETARGMQNPAIYAEGVMTAPRIADQPEEAE